MDEDEITIWASAFIPKYAFRFPYSGGPDPWALWHGDGRGPGVVDGSVRVGHKVTINLNPFRDTVKQNLVFSGETVVEYRAFRIFNLCEQSAKIPLPAPAFVRSTRDTIDLELTAAARNQLEPLSPFLRYQYKLSIDRMERKLHITGSHSQFPAFDLVVGGQLVHHYLPPAGPISVGPLSLYYRPKGITLAYDLPDFL